MLKNPYIELAQKVLTEVGKPLHLDEIAQIAIERKMMDESDAVELARKMANPLAANVRTQNPIFAKVPNGQGHGKFKRGVYRLKEVKRKNPKLFPESLSLDEIEKPGPTFFGTAGEHAVMTELLFRGFNCSIMTVDEGIDIAAAKGGKYFHIQVKSTLGELNGPFNFSISKRAYNATRGSDTFYILVIRRTVESIGKRHICDFVVLHYSYLERLIANGFISDNKETYGIKIVKTDGGRFLIKGQEDLTSHMNNFSLLA